MRPRKSVLAAIAVFTVVALTLSLLTINGQLSSTFEGVRGMKNPPVEEVADAPPREPVGTLNPITIDHQLPAVAAANIVSGMHSTPLFIGFTRNFPLLLQTVTSYVAAGWPASQIHVFDNSGTMDSNELGLLTPSNPFFCNYTMLTDVYGVNVDWTPSLLTFAQLQNLYISTAIKNKWDAFFWSHMDVAILPDSDAENFESFYSRVLSCVKEHTASPNWGFLWFRYDWLSYVNVKAMKSLGAWDPLIPYYTTDCDMNARLRLSGFSTAECTAGHIFDVGAAIANLSDFFFEPKDMDHYRELKVELDALHDDKHGHPTGRLSWQKGQTGGEGEPFYVDPNGFQRGLDVWINTGKDVYAEKWGMGPNCGLEGKTLQDMWHWRDRR
ncbi:hypothetical protein SAICODRAFT_31987 [Saitoella complicata NRRL Y-17804]|uniref:uncharacterized protein n=1 Tax=Saitoella complicata (strain BCRC 22490 / CBS 7301 / JCM 7358 / NBRC 10748 / NRRL Y-17804) TaxID=698492 RepID=UPI0008669320|nr:uncharacterized protein SAICODRAFT_31987 [Saitoella complicata NRRL Y-17804]ODQ50465.1 hypothetical protein SAICODRAFT_31987 [Saitoella complicata NRRL Y-17804]